MSLANTVLIPGRRLSERNRHRRPPRTAPCRTTPAPGAEIHVLATVIGSDVTVRHRQSGLSAHVENSGGTWMVAAIDLTPQISGTEPNPYRATA